MTNSYKKLMREQVQNSLNDYSTVVNKAVPKVGWIRTIRDALGLSTRALAKRLGVSQANVTALESRERKGTITLKSLEEIAEAMNCRLIYSIVPIKPIDKILEDQANVVAHEQISLTNHTMKLEQQELTISQLKKLEDILKKELLQNPKKLWR